MNYSVGCAFNTNDLFMNFPYKKLKVTCEECQKINKTPHRSCLVKRIFRECLKLVIKDVINDNITFHLPTRARKCNIHMRRVQGKDFQNLRRAGKWSNVDFINSYFTGYELGLFIKRKASYRIKTIYVNKELKQLITDNTNKGKQYGDGNIDKTINDYYKRIQELFPEVPLIDIKRILNFGWKSVYLHNSYGGDVFITDKDIWCYMGYLKATPLQHFAYYIKKLIIKLRVLYKRKKIKWDGYYYFALSQNQYEKFFKRKSKMGRPKTRIKFQNLIMYQILDECKIAEYNKPYIFRIPYVTLISPKFFVEKLSTDKAELVETRTPLKFKDILVHNHKYEFL